MIKAQPKLQIEELVTEIIQIFHRQNADEIQVQRHRLNISKLIKEKAPDQASNYVGLGLLDAVQNKKNSSYKNFENALLLAPHDARIRVVFSAVCIKFGDARRAVDIMMPALAENAGQKSLIECAMMRCNNASYFSTSIELGQQYFALTVNEPNNSTHDMIQHIQLIAENIKSSGFTDEDMLVRLETAVDAVRSDYEIEQAQTLFLRNGTYIYQIYINADVDACADMNFRIADAIVDKFPDDASEIVSFMCRPIAFWKTSQELSA